jgi:ribosomal protein L16 Arg81 hydroxylase
MGSAVFDLRRLIHPVDPGTFKREYWEKQPLIVRRGELDYYGELLSLADVDRILSVPSIQSPQIRVVREGKDISLNKLGAGGLTGDVRGVLEALYAEYRRGATVVLQFLHERWEPLMRLCRSLTAEFSASVQVNVYLTPAEERGLNTHYDTHDVFVLQAAGSKHWRLYEGPTRLPLRGQPYQQTMEPGELLDEFDLRSGDLIYIPRGCMHDAVSGDSTSLHLTVGVNTITWAAVVLRGVESAIERDPRFRESLPVGFARDEGLRQRTKARLAELFAALSEQIEPASLIHEAVEEALLDRYPVLDGHLLDLEAAPRVDMQTRVQRRPEIKLCLTIMGSTAALHFHGKMVQIPAYAEAELRFITEAGEFSAADLPGELDDKGKLVLVRSLIREGFLTIC